MTWGTANEKPAIPIQALACDAPQPRALPKAGRLVKIETSFTIETLPLDGTPVDGMRKVVHVINVLLDRQTMRAVVQREHVSLESEEEE